MNVVAFVFIIISVLFVSILIPLLIKNIRQSRIHAERQAYFEGRKIPDKYCCDVKMRFISHDCQYSGGGTKQYHVCYACHSQVDFDMSEDWNTGQETGAHFDDVQNRERLREAHEQFRRNQIGRGSRR